MADEYNALSQEEMLAIITKTTLEFGVDKIMNGLAGLSQFVFSKQQIKKALKSYLTKTTKQLGTAKTLLNQNTPQPLYDFYVPLDMASDQTTYTSPTPSELEEISRCVLLEGVGGCGKSTFLNHIFLQCAFAGKRIPVFVKLRDLEASGKSLTSSITKVLELDEKLRVNQMKALIRQGGFAFLLDGFDEMDTVLQAATKKQIIELASLGDNQVIVTSRPGDQMASWDSFTVLKPCPLTLKKAVELIGKSDFDSEIKERFASELKSRLFDEHESFLSNPLLLTIMLLVYRVNADIPGKLHLFYELAFDALYALHDANKPGGYKRKHKSALAKDDFEKLLSATSLLCNRDSVYEFSKSDFLSYVENAQGITSLSVDREDFFDDLVQAICMLIADGTKFRFTHRSFQEYFAARFLSRLDVPKLETALPHFLRSIDHDMTISLLWEMAPQNVEKTFIIPFIKRLSNILNNPSKVTTSDLAKYVSFLFDEIYFDEEREGTCFSHVYLIPSPPTVVRFIMDKYGYNEVLTYTSISNSSLSDYLIANGEDQDSRLCVKTDTLERHPGLLKLLDNYPITNRVALKWLLDLGKRLEQENRDSEAFLTDVFEKA